MSNPGKSLVAPPDSICHVLVIIDGRSEEVVDVITLPSFELAAFQLQFDVPIEVDPQMLDRYVVGPDDVAFLKEYLSTPVTFDYTTRGYWIEPARMD